MQTATLSATALRSSLQLEAQRTHYEEALAKKDRIICRRDATIAKTARGTTAQLAAKDAEIARLQARVQQFEDAAAAMSRLSSSTEKRSCVDSAAAGAAGGSSSSLSVARPLLSQQQSESTNNCKPTMLADSFLRVPLQRSHACCNDVPRDRVVAARVLCLSCI